MKINTIGYTKKNAEQFFGLIKRSGILTQLSENPILGLLFSRLTL